MRPIGHLSLALLGTAVAGVIALHLVRPRVSPIARRMSDYASGPYGWVMDVVFATTAAGLAALALLLAGSVGRPRLVPAALVVAAVALVVSAIFQLDGTEDTTDAIHRWASGTAGAAAVVAAVGWSVVGIGRPPPRPRGADRLLALLALGFAVVSPLLHETLVTGINQRLVWAALIAWSVVVTLVELGARGRPVSRRLGRRRRGGGSDRG